MTAKGRTPSPPLPPPYTRIYSRQGRKGVCKYALGVKFYLKCAAATECCKFHSHFDYTNPREYVRFRFPLLLLPGGTSKCESLVCEGSN